MRPELLLLPLAACAFSGDAGPPGTAADVLENLLTDYVSPEARPLGSSVSASATDVSDTEVEKFWIVDVAIDENDVSWCEIAMDDAAFVRNGESFADA